MCRNSKRHQPPEQERSDDLGEPAAKRCAADQQGRCSGEHHFGPDDAQGAAHNPLLLDDFSMLFASQDFDALWQDLDPSAVAATAPAAFDDLVDESLFYDEAVAGIAGAKTSPPVVMRPPPSSFIGASDRGSRSVNEPGRGLLRLSPKSGATVATDGACEPSDLPLAQEAEGEGIRRDFLQPIQGVGKTEQANYERISSSHDVKLASLLIPPASGPYSDARAPPQLEHASPSKPYRTFFHLDEMMQGKLKMYKNQPSVIFEWYARVLYSSRENFYQKQYFQFRDLFKETPPYLSGALLG